MIKIEAIIDNYFNSFSIEDKGYSRKKILASILILMIVIIHLRWIARGNFDQLQPILMIDYGFVSILLGLGTYQSVQKIKSENPAKVTSTTTVTNDPAKVTKEVIEEPITNI